MVEILYDAHCHLHEYSDREIEDLLRENDIIITAVSDDLESSIRTLKIWEKFSDRITPCIGIHPWNSERYEERDLERILEVMRRLKIKCIGEVGLDLVFTPHSFNKQLQLFTQILESIRGSDVTLNIHSPGAWGRVLNLLQRYDVKKALFHWYTGPLDLLKEIRSSGYMISINPALRIQEKHMEVAKRVDLEGFLVESDGPYNYKGMQLSPRMILSTVKLLAEIRGLDYEDITRILETNYRRLFS
ncbi:MAG: TatD family hydrolase [Sulfolobales archaeon]